MCGYNEVSSKSVTSDMLSVQIDKASSKYEGQKMVKIYTSGSFLDTAEISLENRKKIFSAFGSAERILFESRPEFITEESFSEIDKRKAEIAIGLETADEEILKKCVRKGFTVADYTHAAERMRSMDVPLRTYLLLKPPYLTERAAVEDTIRSIAYASPHSESISINPVNVQKNTVVDSLWRRGNYRPPWLWSLVEVLRRGKDLSECRLMSSPSGGGTIRGVHNCDDCDRKVLEAVKRFSFSQDTKVFDDLNCGCRKEWATIMDIQDTIGTTVDTARYLSELDME